MGYPFELLFDGCIDGRMIVAVHGAPQATDSIQVAIAIDIDQLTTIGLLDNQRLVVGHLGECVPDNAAVQLGKPRGIGL